MVQGGTAGCADFREGGIEGVRELNEAGEIVTSRPCYFRS